MNPEKAAAPEGTGAQPPPNREWSQLMVAAIMLAVVALAAAIAINGPFGALEMAPYRYGFFGGLAVWAVAAPLAWRQQRAHTTAARLVTVGSTLVGFPALGILLMLLINGVGLSGPVEAQPMQLIRSERTGSGNKSTFTLELAHPEWDRYKPEAGPKPLRIKVSQQVYARFQRPQPVLFQFRAGRLGGTLVWDVVPAPAPNAAK